MWRAQSCPVLPEFGRSCGGGGFGLAGGAAAGGPFAGWAAVQSSNWASEAAGVQLETPAPPASGTRREEVGRRLELEEEMVEGEAGFTLSTAGLRGVAQASSSMGASSADSSLAERAGGDAATSRLRDRGGGCLLGLGGLTAGLEAAARRADWDEAESLWLEAQDEGVAADVQALNALLRCALRAGVYDLDAEAVVRDVCGRGGGVRPNGATHHLLASIMLLGEQLDGGDEP